MSFSADVVGNCSKDIPEPPNGLRNVIVLGVAFMLIFSGEYL